MVEGLRTGEVDVVVGTHGLLSEGVEFHKLGLLVVDEEHRFGVKAKDRIKGMKTGVDVLTLTATPIPRTLEMALTGIREVSHILTPPEDRHPILTYVGPDDPRVVSAAIRREMLREGQVFYVHNRIRSIDRAVERLRALVPDARYGVAHGRMNEGRLEQTMLDFWDHRYDVLVATTIIESGLDLPQVNTLIVERADQLGLAQLYQLRGRVGRSSQRAYAYLFHPESPALSETAYRRLEAVGEFTDLGSGLHLAMRDLEIRGAGSVLGEMQSGHIAAVGVRPVRGAGLRGGGGTDGNRAAGQEAEGGADRPGLGRPSTGGIRDRSEHPPGGLPAAGGGGHAGGGGGRGRRMAGSVRAHASRGGEPDRDGPSAGGIDTDRAGGGRQAAQRG